MAFKELNNLFSHFFYKNTSFKKYLFALLSFVVLILFYSSFLKKTFENNKLETESVQNIFESNKLSNLKEYFLEKYQSPYKKYKYIIQNNDSIEKILNNHNIKYNEIKLIVNDLKKNNLSNIYVGKKMEIVAKKNENEKDSIVNILYLVSNTLIVEIRRSPEGFNEKM